MPSKPTPFDPTQRLLIKVGLGFGASHKALVEWTGLRVELIRARIRRDPELLALFKARKEIIPLRKTEPKQPWSSYTSVCRVCQVEFEVARSLTAKKPDKNRTWCNVCYAVQQAGLTPEKQEERQQRQAAKDRNKYSIRYANKREAEIERCRKYKALKRHTWMDRENWRAEWDLLQAGHSPAWIVEQRKERNNEQAEGCKETARASGSAG